MKLMFLLALFVASALQCMELAISSQILSQPDIIKLIAYALVDTTQPGSLIDHPSCNCKFNRELDKQLLVALRNFSATNKTIHDTIYKLRCGLNEETARFNCHLYTRMGGHVTTAAFMGTPWALTIILDTRFKELETKFGKKKALEELNILLGARITKCVPLYSGLNFTDMPPSYRGPMLSTITGYAVEYESIIKTIEYESIIKTIAKFPSSTGQFILKLMSE